MCKSPVKIDENLKTEYLSLLDKKEKLDKMAESELKNLIDEKIIDFKHKVSNYMINIINEDYRLTSFDEKIYEYYNELIDYYKKAEKIYEVGKVDLVSDNVKKLLDGLLSVIKSRISLFEESRKTYKCDEKSPIYYEKKNIIDDCLNELFDKYNKTGLYKYFENNDENILNQIKIYFSIEVKKCLSYLNDIEKREITAFYFEMLKEEKEILQSVIRVQVEALEKEIQKGKEENFVQSVLLELREAYQHINKHTAMTENAFFKIDKRAEIQINLDDFKLKDYEFEQKINQIHNQKESLKNQFQEIIIKVIKEIDKTNQNGIQTAKKLLEKDCELSRQIVSIFAEINVYYDDVKVKLEKSDEKEILIGIYDTIKIKIESIIDATKILKEEVLANFEEKNPVKIRDFDKNKIIELYPILIEKNSIDDIIPIIESEFTDILGKESEKIIEKTKKRLLQFKREQLLFEISTFEEIMNYSVSRLRESKNKVVLDFVDAIDFGMLSFEETLKENDIIVIHPKPHDMFNGKENEVLMAEKNQDFKKGEIIKVMNSGYKQGDNIIIRANVIAAK